MRTSENSNRSVIASKGGAARAQSLSPSRRSEIAREASAGRWDVNLPRAVAEGDLEIAGRHISCAVLDTKVRLLTQQTFLTAVGRAAKAKGGKGSERLMRVGGLPPFIAAENLLPFISDDLRRAATPIVFRTKTGNRKAYGYDATLLPLVCEVYLSARDAHLEAMKHAQSRRERGENIEARAVLLPTQERIVIACDLLMRGMAKEHIIALVDRATGYHDQEVRDELIRILRDYIAPHLMPYFQRFPDEFFRQVYRIHGWEYEIGNNKRPQYVGHFINRYIYGELPHGVLEKLQELNPVTEAGYRKTQNHRLLTETGIIHLDRQITSTITVMTLSEDKVDFARNFDKAKQRALPAGETRKSLVLPAPPRLKQIPLFPWLEASAVASENKQTAE
jgi:P63C domain